MICFCCGAEYDETARETVIDVIFHADDPEATEEKEVEISHTKSIRFGGKVLKLCPACTRACTIGIVLNGDNMSLVEELEFEEDEQNADISEDKPQDETV